MSSKAKKNQIMDRKAEMEAARVFGKHVSRQKAWLLAAVTTVAAALPMALGLRYWNAIPEMVRTGLILATGEDDSLPRYIVVFGLPGLMCVLNVICHGQLLYNQNRMTVPPTPVRLLGRWGFPVLSVICCSCMTLQSADQPIGMAFLTPCVLGLALLLLGAHMWDCPRTSQLGLRFSFTKSDEDWRTVHRFAGWTYLAAGLLVLAVTMTGALPGLAAGLIALLALAVPLIYGWARSARSR